MKITEILCESIDDDLGKIEFSLRLNGEQPNSYIDLEKELTRLTTLMKRFPEKHADLKEAALEIYFASSNYLSNPLWENLKNEPAARILKTRISDVQRVSMDYYNKLNQDKYL